MDGSVHPPLAMAAPTRSGRTRRLLGGFALVVGFWWLATGLIVAVERNDTTRLIGVITATWLVIVAGVLAWRVRHDTTPRGAVVGFLAGALVWLWLSSLFYAGVIVGPSVSVSPELGQAPSWPLAFRAIVATGWHDLLTLAALGAVFLLPARNLTAWQVLGLFWLVQQVAKLNVFLGVPNAGVRFLPPRLAFLTAFFGPSRFTPWLGLSIAAAALAAAWLAHRAWRAATPHDRWRLGLLALLAGLAAVEYAVLAVPADLPFWDPFLHARDP